METAAPTVKVGRIKRGWHMTKSAWHVLKLDKELLSVPLISTLVGLLALVPFVISFIALGPINFNTETGSASDLSATQYGIIAALIVTMTIISNFFAGVIAHAALQRFRGGDPTIRGSIRAAWSHIGAIALFSILSATVGIILSYIEDRVPFAGKVATWIAQAAWAIATLFAIPVIIDSKEHIGPISAVRTSAGIFKKTWGENIVVSIGVGLIGFLMFLGASITSVALVIGIATIGAGAPVMIAIGVLTLLGLLALAIIFGLLEAIARVAIYYYATTGKAPEVFDRELLRSAMTPKKARKVFA